MVAVIDNGILSFLQWLWLGSVWVNLTRLTPKAKTSPRLVIRISKCIGQQSARGFGIFTIISNNMGTVHLCWMRRPYQRDQIGQRMSKILGHAQAWLTEIKTIYMFFFYVFLHNLPMFASHNFSCFTTWPRPPPCFRQPYPGALPICSWVAWWIRAASPPSAAACEIDGFWVVSRHLAPK